MKKSIAFFLMGCGFLAQAQSHPPQAGQSGSTAIPKESDLFVGWATGIEVERGLIQKSNPALTANGSNRASAGSPSDALGFPDGNAVSLGDEGKATLTFAKPIFDGNGFDFAVFENGGVTFLELGFVEASSDGFHFFRFPAHSETQTATQIGSFGTPAAPYLNNLAGKYTALYGTPFDLSELPDDDLLDKNKITHIRVIDVVGTIDPEFATFDRFGNAVNDPYPTPFASGGFDLQAVGVIHQLTLDVNENVLDNISIYPNPASDYFYVNSEKELTVCLFDAQGRMVLEQKQCKGRVNISGLQCGIYILQLALDEKKTAQKIMIR